MFGTSNGYGVAIVRSKKKKVYLSCDQSGTYRNYMNLTDETHQRKTGSRLIDCLFSVCGVKRNNNIWTLSVTDPTHNHNSSENTSAYLSLQKPNEQEREWLKEMSNAGVHLHKILSSLCQINPSISTS
ncbi:19465_t:CDS:1 [Racocetra persica]|uniref:19465_t:CDS:1 n=1 Tax=Racocetra persica TaxID=160502 RepID=A0ACA9MG70_9GLOM|nr:19465_t:CDS:1 [Racocetra persica]